MNGDEVVRNVYRSDEGRRPDIRLRAVDVFLDRLIQTNAADRKRVGEEDGHWCDVHLNPSKLAKTAMAKSLLDPG